MSTQPLILFIHEAANAEEPLRAALAGSGFRVQCLTRVAPALARIAGGGVDAIVLDLASPGTAEGEKLSGILNLRRAAPAIPVAVLCDPSDGGIAVLAERMGASATLAKAGCAPQLAASLHKLLEGRKSGPDPAKVAPSRGKGRIVTFLGSKGGAGVTTLALNTACSLALRGSAVVAEIRSSGGTLSQHLMPPRGFPDLTTLLDPSDLKPSDVERRLWRGRKESGGIRVLFGPQRSYPEVVLDPARAKAIACALTGFAEHVVIDLPPRLSEVNRALIEVSDTLAVVVEREPVSLEAAGQILRTVDSWDTTLETKGVVVTHRAAVSVPVPLEQIQAMLAVPVLAVIPPAPDDCLAAQRAGRPLVNFNPECMLAESLGALANALAE